MPLSPTTLSSIDALCAKFENENAHSQQVASLALKLFDATHILFGIPAGDRPVLEAACLLHDIAYAINPRRHAEAGAAIVRAEGVEGFAGDSLASIAVLIRLHASNLTLEAARRLVRRGLDPHRLLYSAALLRIADALDSCHLRDAVIASVQVTKLRIRVGVRCAHFPPSVEAARRQAALWREAFPVDIDFRLLVSREAPLLTRTTPVHEAVRRLQQTTVRRHLHGARFMALRARISRFLRVELPRAGASAPEVPVAGPARQALGKALRRALERGHLRKSRSAAKLHGLRIALRRVRYLGAFFGPALGRPVRKLSRRTHALERLLGEIRDADLALERIRQEGPTPPRLLVRQLERIRQANAATLESAWRRFEDPQFLLGLRRQLKE
jgi:hypothetical protein